MKVHLHDTWLRIIEIPITPNFLWLLLVLICLFIILAGLKKILNKTGWIKTRQQRIFFISGASIALWIGLLAVLSINGFFADFSKLPPRPLFAILLPLLIILIIAFSRTGTTLIKLAPLHWFVFIQSFRIFVEILMWLGFLANKLPVQMTFEGRNFDVLTGILSLPVGFLLLKKKRYSINLAIVFNIVGLLLLLNILAIAILSMPTSFRYFMNEPSNIVVASFPFILLPGVLVPIAYTMHVFSLRQLFLFKKNVLNK